MSTALADLWAREEVANSRVAVILPDPYKMTGFYTAIHHKNRPTYNTDRWYGPFDSIEMALDCGLSFNFADDPIIHYTCWEKLNVRTVTPKARRRVSHATR